MKVLFISPYYSTEDRPYIAPFVGRLFNGLKAKVDADLFHFEAKRSLSNYLRARRRIKRLLKEKNYDIVHINWGQTITVIPFFINQRIVVSFRGSDVYGIVNSRSKHDIVSKVVNRISRFAAFRSTACIYVSQELFNYLPTNKPYKIIPSGVDRSIMPIATKKELRKKLGFNDYEIVLLFVGNKRNARKRWYLANKIVDDLKGEYRVTLVNVWRKEPKEVYEFMKAADYLFQVSMQEGSPNIVKEAITCNLSIISTPVGDTPTRIKELDNCYLSVGHDEQSITEVLRSALNNHSFENENDYQFVVDSFSIEHEIEEVLSLYKQIV